MKLYYIKGHPRSDFAKQLLDEVNVQYDEINDLQNCNAYGIREVPALVDGDMILYFPQILSLCGGMIDYGNQDETVSDNS